jgi:cyclopropane fatty-acyl-phospholipid synthase-like methyltransferase
MKNEFWNQRYAGNKSVYGYAPNDFFKAQLDQLSPGRLLLPAEGEGRNAVYAAGGGWNVTAFDFSDVARGKALELARAKGTEITYTLSDLETISLENDYFDAIGLIYVHMPEKTRAGFHQKCMESLKRGGVIILEAFSKSQLQYSSGGPREEDKLYSINDLRNDFATLDITILEEVIVALDEGDFHRGDASVLRMVATRK